MKDIKFRAWDKNKILVQPLNNIYGLQRFLGFLSDDAILMQYTGLKDKNGKEIYEGDILSPSKRLVEFCVDVRLKSVYETYGGSGFYTRAYTGTGCPEELGIFSFGVTQAEVSEIIGNIYENGDLLK